MSRSERPFKRAGWNGSGRTWCLPARAVASAIATLLFSCRSEVVELDDRVRFRPHAEFASIGEGRVVRVDDLLAVIEDLDVIADHLHGQVVPDAGLDLPVPSVESDALAFHDVVQVDVVLERVRPRDVVVVRVLEPPDDPAPLVAFPSDRLALHGKPEVLHLRARVRD